MGRLLGNITSPNVESRFINLAAPVECLIDGAVHLDEIVKRGQIMGLAGNSKYRAYAEALVATGGDFSTAAATFTLENGAGFDHMKNLRVGDVITSSGGTALGTILTFDPATGIGTLAANSANNLAAGQSIIIDSADLDISKANVRILKSEHAVEGGVDRPAEGYVEGWFNTAVVQATSAALAAMSAKIISASEFRLV